MTPPRRRRDRDGGALRWLRLAILLLAVGAVVGLALPSDAFSSMNAQRTANVDVTGDQSGVLGLTVYSCVDKDNVDPLVDVENNFGASLSVTVSLHDGTLGDLHVGTQSGDSVTFSLATGATDTVSFETTTNGPWPKTVSYDVDATTGGNSAFATRSSQIENNCGSSTPTPTPTPTATPVPGNEQPVADFTMTRRGSGNKLEVDASSSYDPDGTIQSYEWYVDGTYETSGETANFNAPSGAEIRLVVTDDVGDSNSTTKTAP